MSVYPLFFFIFFFAITFPVRNNFFSLLFCIIYGALNISSSNDQRLLWMFLIVNSLCYRFSMLLCSSLFFFFFWLFLLSINRRIRFVMIYATKGSIEIEFAFCHYRAQISNCTLRDRFALPVNIEGIEFVVCNLIPWDIQFSATSKSRVEDKFAYAHTYKRYFSYF